MGGEIMSSILLKVVNADLTSPFKGFQFEVGKKYVCPDFDPDTRNECSCGFYATEIEGLTYAIRPDRRVFEVSVGGRNANADPVYKRRWEEMTLIREVFRPEIEALAVAHEPVCGYKLSEALFPINSLLQPQRTPTDADIALLKQWASVRASVGNSVGNSAFDSVYNSAWDSVPTSVLDNVWASVRGSVLYSVFDSVLASVRTSVLDNVLAIVRNSVLDSAWVYIGSLFPGIKNWKNINHVPGVYPFQPAVDLWHSGLVPSYDGKTWRLHSGEKAEIVWKGKL
jgi:hypothetical protein